ncbi:putative phosphoketolase [Lachnellula occidentalis]|uniref:Putative phosphoketolase n=1 Tax=Lachnellula occidentalis TaxID=215460 RepID=A0A8H8UH34_9HELO|nr:putative phosphoketolase [Lachnellula occidentalis]
MPGEVIDRPNPKALASHIPDEVLNLSVQLQKMNLSDEDLRGLEEFRRASNYIAAGNDNALLERDLTHDDIKPRLLGHWGTCPGLTLVYAHLNYLTRKNDLDLIYVVGPGHGAPAILASLWLEGSLGRFYPQYSNTRQGLHNLITGFSTPHGFPSHINAETPGAIHEGGELGYALSVAFGAVMDKPDLVVACVVGDGEAESGPTAGAWHAAKYIDPAESGAVIPIVHVNGFKISERTIYGCMDDKEMVSLFTGYGYQCRFVEDLEDIDRDLATSMQWALDEIRKIQKAARSGKPIMKPRWPVLIMRTPKGWSGPKVVDGEFVEGSFHAHQVPLMAVKSSKEQLADLQKWLLSYGPAKLFTEAGAPTDSIKSIIPVEDHKRLGQRAETYKCHEPLKLPDWKQFGAEKALNNPSLRLFSPDELVSNKLDAVFNHTGRDFQWDEFSNARGGRVIEILSEHTCQGFLQGYTLTGRTGIFPSYESFLGIIHTMMVQYSKFNKMARETTWRTDISSINYIETSTWTRQEHNGFSHQNPSFIGAVLNLKPDAARVYLPPDANTFLSTISHCLASKNYVNLMVGSKQPQPVFLSVAEADAHCRAGASIWKFCSTDEGLRPDVVLVGIGSELMFEVVVAAAHLRRRVPGLRVRVVNVTDLMILEAESGHPHSMSNQEFSAMFTSDRPVHFNYHGYSNEIKGLLFGRENMGRMSIACYKEEGSTTTPFDMMLRNDVSRFNVMEAAIRGAAKHNEKINLEMTALLGEIRHQVSKVRKYIMATGKDLDGTFDIPRFEGTVFGKENKGEGEESKEDGFFVN